MRILSIVTTLLLLLALTGCEIACPADPPASTTAANLTVESTYETQAETHALQETTEEIALLSPIEIRLEQMSLEEKVGQLFLARCPANHAIEDVENFHLGGYILFNRDFENKDALTIMTTISSYQTAAPIPMLIAVDEEGGSVTRVSSNGNLRQQRFYSPRYLYNHGGLDAVLETEQEKCALLRSLGINVNMAPVCDISQDPSAFMYNRSLGQDPEITGQFAAAMVKVMSQHKIGSVLKHFPGYGNNADTHGGLAMDARPLEELVANDLHPFAVGIAADCDAILVSHVIVQSIDPNLPATLSPAVHAYLRNEMGFDGVIITDDLVMEAVRAQYGVGEAAVLAVLAGNDLLCVSEYEQQYQAVLHAIYTGRIPMDTVNAAVTRILRWKIDLGLFQTIS